MPQFFDSVIRYLDVLRAGLVDKALNQISHNPHCC